MPLTNRFRRVKLGAFVLVSLMVFTNCKDKTNTTTTTFDKGPIMVNLADNYIIPAYDSLQLKTTLLQAKWDQFLGNMTSVMLSEVQLAWMDANRSFQTVKLFDFGPALNVGLGGALGTFPADTAQIQLNISNGSYDLLTAENIDAIGFDALDYLFFRPDALNTIANSIGTQNYISALLTKMNNEINSVVSAWNSGYRTTFVAGVGTSSTSPFALLVNSLCKDFELAKTTKLGIPIGMQSLGIIQPHYLEARRSGMGQTLLIENMQAVKNVFQGIGIDGTNGQGFDDYLNAIEKSTLSTTITNRFDYLITAPMSWSGGIEGMINSENQTLIDYYNYIQGTVVYLKTDMSSAFGVLITYQDNDGD
jgi:predicted lipoprotein